MILDAPDVSVWASIEENWPDNNHFIADDRVAFIASDEAILTKDIMEAIKIGHEHPSKAGAIVLKFGNARTGFWSGSLWEWLGLFE